jgi:hypothetical protein
MYPLMPADRNAKSLSDCRVRYSKRIRIARPLAAAKIHQSTVEDAIALEIYLRQHEKVLTIRAVSDQLPPLDDPSWSM